MEFLSLRSNHLTRLGPYALSGVTGHREVCFNNPNCRVDLTENDVSLVEPGAFSRTQHVRYVHVDVTPTSTFTSGTST